MLESLIAYHSEQLKAAQEVVSRHGVTPNQKALAALGCMEHRQFLDKLTEAERLLTADHPRWKHVKRGSLYAEVGELTVQTETPLEDGATLVLYRDTDLRWWGRPPAEFHDGRFVAEPS